MKYLISLWFWIVGICFFGLSLCILIPMLLLASRNVTFSAAKFFFNIQLFLMGMKLQVNGREHVEKGRPYLILGNHQSLFDVFVVPIAIPLVFVGVEAAYHFSFPIWGFLIKKWGNIPIQRSNLKSAINSLEIARKTLDSGLDIAILPEGHRTKTGKIAPFKKGPFHLARETQADILPFGINGLYQYQKKGSFLIRPGLVTVNIGKPIPNEIVKSMSVEDLQASLFDQVKRLSGEK